MIKLYLKRIGLIILFAAALFGFLFFFGGCNTNQQQIKKTVTRKDFKSDEAWHWFLCTQESQKTQDSILKDKKDHNVLECQPFVNELTERGKLNRSKELYEYCGTKRVEGHSWQNCYDKILVK